MMNRDLILTALREKIPVLATSRVSMAHAEDLTQNVLAVLHDKYPQVAELVELVPLGFQTSINTIYTWDFRCRKQLLALMGGCRE